MSYRLIDHLTGAMRIGPLEVESGIALSELETSDFWRFAKLIVDAGKWRTYQLGPVACGDQMIGFNLVFELGYLGQIVFSCDASSDKRSQRLNDELLREDLGATDGQYTWGTASSRRDPRSGPLAVISYKDGLSMLEPS